MGAKIYFYNLFLQIRRALGPRSEDPRDSLQVSILGPQEGFDVAQGDSITVSEGNGGQSLQALLGGDDYTPIAVTGENGDPCGERRAADDAASLVDSVASDVHELVYL